MWKLGHGGDVGKGKGLRENHEGGERDEGGDEVI